MVCCGDFTGGAISLHDLKYVIEMAVYDMLLFSDSLLHHCNESTTRAHKSLVAFMQENMYDYWCRKYKMLSKRQIHKEPQNENLKVAKQLMAIMKEMDKEQEKAKAKGKGKKHTATAAAANKRKRRGKVIALTTKNY